MTAKEIIEKHLRDNGFDGLTDGDECSCLLDDLIPCETEWSAHCEPGYKSPCDKSCDAPDECDYHMSTTKGVPHA